MDKKTLKVYIPGPTFPSLSVTGRSCALNCAHCGRHYLEGMVPVNGRLLDYCMDLEEKGGKGCLLSGGLDGRLKVPLDGYAEDLREIKRRTGLKLNAHIGFVDQNDLEWIKNVDVVSMDFVSDDRVIKQIYGITRRGEDYEEMLAFLTEAGVRVAPHITIGLDFGRIHWEYKAIDIISRYPVDVLVLDVLIPTKGTEMESVPKPGVDESLKVVEYARERFSGELSIGCMRPGGKWREEFDRGAILLGIDRLTNPPKRILEWARRVRKVEVIHECCVM